MRWVWPVFKIFVIIVIVTIMILRKLGGLKFGIYSYQIAIFVVLFSKRLQHVTTNFAVCKTIELKFFPLFWLSFQLSFVKCLWELSLRNFNYIVRNHHAIYSDARCTHKWWCEIDSQYLVEFCFELYNSACLELELICS